jgi:uncharacterized lipoprotein YajG
MKTQQSLQMRTKFYSAIFMLAMMLVIASCATNQTFLNSSVVPGATGNVKVKKDKNQNYVINLKVEDLAAVDKLQTSKQMYVVWMETERGNIENLGQMKTSTGFMSKQRTASLETVSSFKPIRFFITAENEKNARYPDTEILSTGTFYK